MAKYLFLTILFIEICRCGFERNETGARAIAMGGATTANFDTIWSLYTNPAGISGCNNLKIGSAYTPQQFGLSELASGGIVAVSPISFGVVGGAVRYYGFKKYNEFTATFSYGMTVSAIAFGVNLNYYHLSIEQYGSAVALGIDAGILAPLSEKLLTGLFIRNLNSPTIGISKNKLPQSFSIGIGYLPFNSVQIGIDFYKETLFEPSLRTGVEYWLIDALAIRAGITDNPDQYSGGIGIKVSTIRFDYALTKHPDLGWSHSFSLTIF
ncbi:MAG: hypothetical protein HY964_02400 [Ignavibacteriales bacterium]|nr:hypothetical protein [Ignavibacteriales bacterium]